MSAAMLSIEGLGKSFTVHQLGKRIKACEGIDLRVGPGEFVGITGRSGSGKSTILKLIYRSYLPESGQAWYDSERFGRIDLFRAEERAIIYLRRREIGYVSQFLDLVPRTTAREAIERAALDVGMESERARAESERMLMHFELDEELWDSYASSFSGGEKLRLNVARAMVKHPRLLLLDEPTASLDGHSKGKVRELIEQLKAEGTTMLGIFHDLQFMEGLCDREYSISRGGFVPHGTFAALSRRPALPYPFVETLVREAGAKLRAAAAEAVTIESKGGDRRDLVTAHDRAIQDFLVSGISARLPSHSFLAEEEDFAEDFMEDAAAGDQGPTWIIDPIDGTTNFACEGKDFAISVALYEGGLPVFGLVYDVMADELYSAAPGTGAFLNGRRLGPAGRAASIEDAVVDISMDSCAVLRRIEGLDPFALTLAGRGHRALGCASLAICRIARGSLDVYASARLCPWDYAAADIVLAEAGGVSSCRFLEGGDRGRRSRRFYAAAGNAVVLDGAIRALHGGKAGPD